MSESNLDIPLPSQESEEVESQLKSDFEASQILCKSDGASSVSESDKLENIKSDGSALSASKIARPTGLKLPVAGTGAGTSSSRIARLCNNAARPTIPANTCTVTNGTGSGGGSNMSAASSNRNATEEQARGRLSDVSENNERNVPFFSDGNWEHDKTTSGGSVLSDSGRKSSPDDLSKKRSSDATISADSFYEYWKPDFEPHHQASDASAVLTENTDQFIIGDRVWVGGIKPGQIAYIGETQFAPGEWAGIVLDEPIGKNDGTVANFRYFQCEPKKGIFSRLTRLTKYPLMDGAAGEPAATRSATPEARKSNGSLLSSVPKKSPLVLTPTSGSKNSVSKPTSPDSALHSGLAVGDRVIVKSSQGSKAGMLRYLGTTEFAPGEWCGVELDDPLGKNDGSVSGKRYFDCRPKFGLFAPLHKVSKSPANKRLFQVPCAIHRGTGSGTGIRRQGSKESLVSMSSVASTTTSTRSTNKKVGVRSSTTATLASTKSTLQETLKEKDAYIEHLLKERDLERAEVTRAANQADDAERKLACLKQEFERHKAEYEARISNLDSAIILLKSKNDELSGQLEDEKKKCEDLQFRFEEESIDKTDFKSTVGKCEEKINLLEKTLAEERKRVEALEHDSNKLFEAEEQMVIVKDELDTTKEELEEQKKIRTALEQEQIHLEAHLTSARAEIESLKIENDSLNKIVEGDEKNLKENLADSIRKLEEVKKDVDVKDAKLEELLNEMKTKERILSDKEKEYGEKYSRLVRELGEKHKIEMDNLNAELKLNWDAKLKAMETDLGKKIARCNSLEGKLNELNMLISKGNAEKKFELSQQEEFRVKMENELRERSEELERKNRLLNDEIAKTENHQKIIRKLEMELTEAKNFLSSSTEKTDERFSALNEIIEGQKVEATKLKAEIEKLTAERDSSKMSQVDAKKEWEEKMKRMENLLNEKDSELEKIKCDLDEARKNFDGKTKEFHDLSRSREEELKRKIKVLEEAEVERKVEMETLMKNSDALKNSLEVRENELKSEQVNSKKLGEKLMALEENYGKISEEKDRLELEAGDAARKLQSAEEKLGHVTEQKTKLEIDLSNFINSSNDSNFQLSKLNEDLRWREKEVESLRMEISEKTRNFERTEQELRQSLEKLEYGSKIRREEFENEKNRFVAEMEKMKREIDSFADASRQRENEWKKEAEISGSEAESRIRELMEKLTNSEEKNAEEKKEHGKRMMEIMEAKNDAQAKLEEVKSEAEKRENSMAEKIKKLDAECVELKKSLEKMSEEFSANEKKLLEKTGNEISSLSAESEKLREELRETREKFDATVKELEKAKGEKNIWNDEKTKLESIRAEMEKAVGKANGENAELAKNLTAFENENKILKETVNRLQEEKLCLEKSSAEKMKDLSKLSSELIASENSRKSSEGENELKMKLLQGEIAELMGKMQKIESERYAEATEKANRIKNLELELNRLAEESERILLEKRNETEKANVFAVQLKKELDEGKGEREKSDERIGMLEENLRLAKIELESEKKKNEECGKRLKESEAERIDLIERFEEQGKRLANASKTEEKLEELGRKLTEAEKEKSDLVRNSNLERETLEKRLETTNDLLSRREKETVRLSNEIDSLNRKLSGFQTSEEVECKKERKGEILSEDSDRRNATNDFDFDKGQIDFLNSVIVDMQKKNDALKARIEILEMGFSPGDADEFSAYSIDARAVAPRLFCDICDMFDLHDTEDCPKQTTEEEPLPNPKSSRKKLPPPERPYCETCEVFGHDTADCDDAETF